MILKILSCKAKPFKSDEGNDLNYFWCKAENEAGFVIQFGTPNDMTRSIGTKLDLAIEQTLGADGKVRYKEAKL